MIVVMMMVVMVIMVVTMTSSEAHSALDRIPDSRKDDHSEDHSGRERTNPNEKRPLLKQAQPSGCPGARRRPGLEQVAAS